MNLAAVRGRLLVATPTLSDPNFAGTVVLLLEHGEDGTLGVVLNRPSEVALSEALPQLSALAAAPPVVFAGGPMQQQAVLGLVRVDGDGDDDDDDAVLPQVAVADLSADLPSGIQALRLFAGYAGWGPRQLESEVDAGGWFLVDARPEDAFAGHPETLWRAVLVRQGGVFRTVTPAPTLN